MSIDTSVSDFLNRTGAPAAKFDTVGKVVEGVVEAAEVTDQTDISTGEVKRWPDGNPRKQLVITIATDERDPENPDDDGRRRIFAKGNMLTAVKEAIRKSGGQLEVGGKVKVRYEGDGEATQRGFNPPKLFKAKYEPPTAPAVSADDL